MTREQAINYLISSGFSEEQVSEVVRALTYEPTTKNDLVPRNVVERIIKSPRTKEQMLLVLNSLPSQEPTTKNDLGVDAVSRQAVLDQTYLWSKDEFLRVTNPFDYLRKRINSLSPVTPQPKTGHWIDDNENEIDAQYGRHLYKCSKCNEYADMFVGGTEDWWDIEKPNYCPNCGCRMVEPQESEDKE